MPPRPISFSGSRQTFEIAHPLNQRGRKFYTSRKGGPLQVEPPASICNHARTSASNGRSRNSSAISTVTIPNGDRLCRRPFSNTTSRNAATGVKGVSSKRARATKSVLGAPKAPTKEKNKPQNAAAPYTKDGHNIYESLARVVAPKPDVKSDPDTPPQSLDGGVVVEKGPQEAQIESQSATATNDGPGSTTSTKPAHPVLDEKHPKAPISQAMAPVCDTPNTKADSKSVTMQAPVSKKKDRTPKDHFSKNATVQDPVPTKQEDQTPKDHADKKVTDQAPMSTKQDGTPRDHAIKDATIQAPVSTKQNQTLKDHDTNDLTRDSTSLASDDAKKITSAEDSIPQTISLVCDTSNTKFADKNVTIQISISKKQNRESNDLIGDSASLASDDAKKIISVEDSISQAISLAFDMSDAKIAEKNVTIRANKDSGKSSLDVSAVNKARKLPSLISIEQSLYPGWKGILEHKKQFDLLRSRRENLERLHRFQTKTDLVLNNAKRILENKVELSKKFNPTYEGLDVLGKSLSSIYSLSGRTFCNEYMGIFAADFMNILAKSHEWRAIVFLRSRMNAAVTGDRNGRWVYHRTAVQRLVWKSFIQSAGKLDTQLLDLLRGHKSSLKRSTHARLKRVWRHNRFILASGRDYRSIFLQKSVRNFFLSKPKSNIHWKQLDLWAPFSDFITSSLNVASIASTFFRISRGPVETPNGVEYHRAQNNKLRELVSAWRRDMNANILPLMEQIFELNWLRLNLQELQNSPQDAHRKHPDFRVSKPLSENPQRFYQWLHHTVDLFTPKQPKQPLSVQKPKKLVRRLVDRKSGRPKRPRRRRFSGTSARVLSRDRKQNQPAVKVNTS